MPLHDVLSAVKSLILNRVSIPKSESERFELYRNIFPGMSEAECEDLAKVNPAELHTYTVSIFASRHKLLRAKFPVSFSVLERGFPETYGRKFNGFQFARAMQEKKPWTGNETRGLAANFCLYVTEDLNELVAANTYLPDLLKFESSKLDLFRDQADSAYFGGIDLSNLSDLTVNELLELSVSLRPPFRFHRFDFDILSLVEQYRRTGDFGVPAVREIFCVASRDRFLSVRWTPLMPSVYAFLSEFDGDKGFKLGSLGRAFLADSRYESEESSFREFAAFLTSLNDAGAIKSPTALDRIQA